MRYIFKTILPLLTAAFTTFGCTQDSLEQDQNNSATDIKTAGDLEFIYRVTDMEGNLQSKFQEGENFMFSFVVKNRGNEDVSIAPWIFPFTIEDFFAVYKKNKERDGTMPINKSFTLGGNTRDLPYQTVSSKGEIEYRIPWLTQKDTIYIMPLYRPKKDIYNKRRYMAVEPLPQPLSTGVYYSGFTLNFKEKEIGFSITFTIE